MRHVLLLGALLCACTSVETHDLDPHDDYARTEPAQVSIYRWDEEVPPRPYEAIAIFRWKMDRSLWDKGDVDALKGRAAKIGADAVILGEYCDAKRSSAWNAALIPLVVVTGSNIKGFSVEQVMGTGLAIRYLGPAPDRSADSSSNRSR